MGSEGCGGAQILMGRAGDTYNLLGGKRKEGDRGPEGTAIREMMEESSGASFASPCALP
jgi:hypothetical protein